MRRAVLLPARKRGAGALRLLARGRTEANQGGNTMSFGKPHDVYLRTLTDTPAGVDVPGEGKPKRRDREADRQRFTDPAFNRWLDEGISDSGHTVWDQIGSVVDAWAGWVNREHYTADGHAPGVDVPQGQEKDRG